jgi:Xaa-Pro aminopeptidase
MRKIKDEGELKSIQQSIRVAEEAFDVLKQSIRLGQTELELAARIEYEMKRRGSHRPAFPTICAEGPNAALPHAHPGKRKVKSGSAILVDWGAWVGRYCSDLTRVLFVGSIPRELGKVYEIVLEAQRMAIAAIKPGVKMCDVDAVARNFIASQGYKKEFTHGLGHGVGIDIHEAPSLSWRSDEALAEGMVVTVEPGIYLPGVGGVRIEDDVLVAKRGCRILTRLDKSLSGAVIPARR